jgi:hypothetical protein
MQRGQSSKIWKVTENADLMHEEKLFEKTYELTANHFHKWYGLAAASFLAMGTALIFYNLLPIGKIRFLWYAYAMLGTEVGIIFFWFFNKFRVPRNNKKRSGLVICIHADTNEAEQNLKKDFISTIQKSVRSGEMGEIFNIVTIPNHLASKYNNPKDIYKLHKKVKGHIYIYGDIKKRKHGEEQYLLSLGGLVLHRPVALQVSNELSKDFLATLPKGINFQEIFSFQGFQISAEIVLKSVEYISGIAAAISGRPDLAIRLHTDLKNKIISIPLDNKFPADHAILKKIDNLLADEHAVLAVFYLNKNNEKKTREYLQSSFAHNPNCYHALIVASIVAFSWENEPKKALGILKKCHNISDPTWRYNEAFLHFWLGQYPSAWKQCEKIKKQNYPNDFDVSRQCTDFNENLTKTVTDKPVLYFWLGFNYYFKQNNLSLALQPLETFVERSDESMGLLTQKANGWLTDIKKEGGWK